MRGIKNLSSGLFIGLLIAATVFGALVLSVRGQPTSISELPIPTVTLQTDIDSPTPTHGVAQPVAASVTATASATPAPTPTICPIPTDWQRYSVGPFDTLISIAQRFNLTLDQLVQTNCLVEPGVTMGQTVYVPAFKPTPTNVPCFPPFNWARYVVRPGDTLSSIAARYGLSLYTLMRVNCLSTTYIYYGQVLYVPPVYPSVTLVPTPFVPTFTPTPPMDSLTPTIPPPDTPTETTPPPDTPTLTTPRPDTPIPTTPPPDTPTQTTPPPETPTQTTPSPGTPVVIPTVPVIIVPPTAEAPTPVNTPEPPPTGTTSP